MGELNPAQKRGNAAALLPILVFLVLYLGCGLLFEYGLKIEMGFYQTPAIVAFLIALFVACVQNRALDFNAKLKVMANGVADVIVPNLTEAEFLTERYRGAEALDRHQAREVVDALLACGPRSVVITSGLEAETGRHVVWGYCHRQGRYFTLPFDFIKVHFPGTGDVFSAVLVGELLAGTGLEQAARKAMDTVERLVCLDRNEVEKNKGIRIERFLKELDL